MFCRNCGKQLEDGFKVCPYCGEPVSSRRATPDARRRNSPPQKILSPYIMIFRKSRLPCLLPHLFSQRRTRSPSRKAKAPADGKFSDFPRLLRSAAVVPAARQPRALSNMEERQTEGRQWHRSVHADRSRGRRGTRSYYCDNRRSAVCDNRVDDCV